MKVNWMNGLLNCAAAIAITAICAPQALAQSLNIPTASAMSRVAKKVAPLFPPAAKQLNISGMQDVEITVDESGSVVDAKVLKGNAIFSAASLAAVKQWKFTPLLQDGAAKSFTSVIVFNYSK
ncbi:MAG: energy transducer TonB [Bryobacteraceae bacterium]|nr:energy transducer TonB [Bryobacteraceae bacterium]